MPCGKPKAHGDGPCQRPAGWGRDADDGPCRDHADNERPHDDGQTGQTGDGDRPWGELQLRRILDALEDGATYEIAARAAGVSPRTFRRWRNEFDELVRKVQRAEAESAGEALGIVQNAAESGDWRAASWLLEKRHGYDDGGEIDGDDVREFVEAVQSAIFETLDNERASEVMDAIDAKLEERADG